MKQSKPDKSINYLMLALVLLISSAAVVGYYLYLQPASESKPSPEVAAIIEREPAPKHIKQSLTYKLSANEQGQIGSNRTDRDLREFGDAPPVEVQITKAPDSSGLEGSKKKTTAPGRPVLAKVIYPQAPLRLPKRMARITEKKSNAPEKYSAKVLKRSDIILSAKTEAPPVKHRLEPAQTAKRPAPVQVSKQSLASVRKSRDAPAVPPAGTRKPIIISSVQKGASLFGEDNSARTPDPIPVTIVPQAPTESPRQPFHKIRKKIQLPSKLFAKPLKPRSPLEIPQKSAKEIKKPKSVEPVVMAMTLAPQSPARFPKKPRPIEPIVLAKALKPQPPVRFPKKPKPIEPMALVKALQPQPPVRFPKKPEPIEPIALVKALKPQPPVRFPKKPNPVKPMVLAKALQPQAPATIPPGPENKVDNPLGPFRFKKPAEQPRVTAATIGNEEKTPTGGEEVGPVSLPASVNKPESAVGKHREAIQSLAKLTVMTGNPEAPALKKEAAVTGESKGAWAVNVLSTKDTAILRKIFDALLETPHQVYSYQAKVKGENWHRIRVGFFKTREEAERVGRQLSAKHNLPAPWLVKPGPQELERFRQ